MEVKQISASDEHTAIVTKSGKLFTCGSYQHGKLGHNAPQNMSYLTTNIFREVQFVTESQSSYKGNLVSQVACGDYHTICLTRKGEVYVWGGHAKGKRGDDPDKRPTRKKIGDNIYNIPCLIQTLQNKRIVQIECGQFHSMALDIDGIVWSWGDQSNAQCGHADYLQIMGNLPQNEQDAHQLLKPRAIAGLKVKLLRIESIACGSNHSFAITIDNEIYSWGSNKYGQCGISPDIKNGKQINDSVPHLIHVPKRVYLPPNSYANTHQPHSTSIEGGEHHSLILLRCNQVQLEFGEVPVDITCLFTFGNNQQGQLGHGNNTNYRQPKQIRFFDENGLIDT